jgi:hypothetical protein
MFSALSIVAILVALPGCEERPAAQETPAVSKTPEPTATPPLKASEPAPTASAPKPSHACPEGSSGEGTFKDPCEAKGKTRVMTAEWTGKMDDQGPSFRVTNKTNLEILFGQIVVYFYDKSGKLIEVPGGSDSKEHKTKQKCSGNIFAGPMKPGEKAVLTFSCVNKSHVPENTAHIEAELRMVGFTGSDGKKADTYWRNEELTPDDRPKGGIK